MRGGNEVSRKTKRWDKSVLSGQVWNNDLVYGLDSGRPYSGKWVKRSKVISRQSIELMMRPGLIW